ncbi:phosphatase PAP2 family protein [Candidatus Woesearchaeota archaeon]|nr:phosphatase PAP2 family protein [Candidatus Woesearchaeota archaeon]
MKTKDSVWDCRPCLVIALLLVLGMSFLLDSMIHSFFSAVKYHYLDIFFSWFSSMITIILVLLVLSSLFMYEERKTRYILPMWVSFALAMFSSYVLKFLIQRPRPFPMYHFGFPDFAFPSAHAAMCFAVLPFLEKEFPKIRIFWIVFVSIVLLSRLYLGVHWFSDIVGGSVLGYLFGHFIIVSMKKGWRI